MVGSFFGHSCDHWWSWLTVWSVMLAMWYWFLIIFRFTNQPVTMKLSFPLKDTPSLLLLVIFQNVKLKNFCPSALASFSTCSHPHLLLGWVTRGSWWSLNNKQVVYSCNYSPVLITEVFLMQSSPIPCPTRRFFVTRLWTDLGGNYYTLPTNHSF